MTPGARTPSTNNPIPSAAPPSRSSSSHCRQPISRRWSPTRTIVVIEAKAPGQPLNGAVQSQARSYAFALGAPMFLLTNGSRLQIYRRGVQFDQLVVNCTVEELVEQWPVIVEALNP